MKLIKLASAALNQTPMDWDGNAAGIVGAIREAKIQGASLLCLPELCITGYGCEDMFISVALQRRALAVLAEILPETQGIAACFGLPLALPGGLYNAACLAADGEIIGFAAKQHLAFEGLHYEPRWFRPWPAGRRVFVEIDERRYPAGDLCFDLGGVVVGFEICEDAWVADRPGNRLAARGADVILNPSASHFAFGKDAVRRSFILDGSRAFGVCYVYSNLLGNEAGRAVYDGGTMIAASGEMIAEGRRFSFEDFQVITAVADIDEIRMKRSRDNSPTAFGEEAADFVIHSSFHLPGVEPEPAGSGRPLWESSAALKEEEFVRAEALALFDYMRKSRSRGFVVSLSGGADSSACACLTSMMVRFAAGELGLGRFKEKLGYFSELKELDFDPETGRGGLMRRMLLCVYQATRNSSEITRNAAEAVAEAVGAEFLVFEVDKLVNGYREMVEGGIGRRLSWKTDDIALQNIQARARAPGVWMLANIRGALLQTTSNRSEAAVGYATMDGDTCGGLAPLAGIDKVFLRSWLKWLETGGPEGLGNIPALNLVNRQQPTAELRPKSEEQTDEADLMPYEILEAAEDAAIGEKKSPLETFLVLRANHSEKEESRLAAWVEKFFRLWARNQWKRERYAPSFHVDDKNLDPRSWCRFPILSGGFEKELDELREYLKAR